MYHVNGYMQLITFRPWQSHWCFYERKAVISLLNCLLISQVAYFLCKYFNKNLIFIMQIEVRSILLYQEGGGHYLVMLQLMTYQKGTVFIFLVMLIRQMNLRVFPGTVHGPSNTKHRTWLQHRVGQLVSDQQLVTHHKDLNR